MTNKEGRVYDLEERTAKFGEAVIGFMKLVPRTAITLPLISQGVRAATSVGANYCEADNAESAKDFVHKLSVCKKEAKETRHWLRMIVSAEPSFAETARPLYRESTELLLIFNAIINKTKK